MTNMDNRMATLQHALDEKQEWQGAMTNVDAGQLEVDKWGSIFEQLAATTHVGASPWLVACWPYSMRYGAHAFPLPGYGCFCQCHVQPDSTWDVFIVVLPVAGIVSNGIACQDAVTFFDTPAGAKYIETDCTVFKLETKRIVLDSDGLHGHAHSH